MQSLKLSSQPQTKSHIGSIQNDDDLHEVSPFGTPRSNDRGSVGTLSRGTSAVAPSSATTSPFGTPFQTPINPGLFGGGAAPLTNSGSIVAHSRGQYVSTEAKDHAAAEQDVQSLSKGEISDFKVLDKLNEKIKFLKAENQLSVLKNFQEKIGPQSGYGARMVISGMIQDAERRIPIADNFAL